MSACSGDFLESKSDPLSTPLHKYINSFEKLEENDKKLNTHYIERVAYDR